MRLPNYALLCLGCNLTHLADCKYLVKIENTDAGMYYAAVCLSCFLTINDEANTIYRKEFFAKVICQFESAADND